MPIKDIDFTPLRLNQSLCSGYSPIRIQPGDVMQNKEKPKSIAKRSIKVFLKSIGIIFLILFICYFVVAVILPGININRQRPKWYCNRAEWDAQNIAVAISDYFADPNHTTLPTISGDSVCLGYTLSSKGGQNIAWVTGDPESTITIIVQDGSGKCPDDYQERSPDWDSGKFTFRF